MTMIGPNVRLVRVWDTGLSRNVASAEVPVGCLSAAEDPEFPVTSAQETMDSGHF
jgi:hypothetical protein